MDAKGKLRRLLRIQQLAVDVRAAQRIVEGAPGRIEEIEARFRERNAEYVAVKDRFEELEQDQRQRSSELTTLEEHRNKYMADLMGVQNQREYAAMLREIDAVKAEIAGHEEAILKDMEAIEGLKDELANFEEHIKKERVAVEKERAEIEVQSVEARETAQRLSAERASIEAELPGQMIATVRKLEATRQGMFLSKAENGTCLSCFVRVRPQMFQEIKQGTAVHTCGNCRRFLYHAASLEPTDGSAGGASSNVEAVNGGAV